MKTRLNLSQKSLKLNSFPTYQVIKYAKKLGNQVLSGLKYLKDNDETYDGYIYRLHYPEDDMRDESDNRPYISMVRYNFFICSLVCPSFNGQCKLILFVYRRLGMTIVRGKRNCTMY